MVMSSVEKKIFDITSLYRGELESAYQDMLKEAPYTYFLEMSLARGDLTVVISHPMLQWNLSTARWNREHWTPRGLWALRRAIPLRRRRYTEYEIRLIKYNLHFQLALGLEIDVIFDDDIDFVEQALGFDNCAVVRGKKLLTDYLPYDPDVSPSDAFRVQLSEPADDVFSYLTDVTRSKESYKLRYTDDTFTGLEDASARRVFGDFLLALHSNRCAVCDEPIGLATCQIDHVIQNRLGGNNSLINLQATCFSCHRENRGGRSGLNLEPQELSLLGLGTTYHLRLSDRKLVGVLPGEGALFDLTRNELDDYYIGYPFKPSSSSPLLLPASTNGNSHGDNSLELLYVDNVANGQYFDSGWQPLNIINERLATKDYHLIVHNSARRLYLRWGENMEKTADISLDEIQKKGWDCETAIAMLHLVLTKIWNASKLGCRTAIITQADIHQISPKGNDRKPMSYLLHVWGEEFHRLFISRRRKGEYKIRFRGMKITWARSSESLEESDFLDTTKRKSTNCRAIP